MNVLWSIRTKQSNKTGFFINIILLLIAVFMINTIWCQTKSICSTLLFLLGIHACTCRFVKALGRNSRTNIMRMIVATTKLKITTTSASEIHVSSASLRVRVVGIGIKCRTLRKVLRRVTLIRGLRKWSWRALMNRILCKAIARLS